MKIQISFRKSRSAKFFYLDRSNDDHWIDATYWLILGFVGGLMPLWGGLLILKLLSQNVNFIKFTQHGEFAIYSASMLTAAFYVVTKEISLSYIFGLSEDAMSRHLRERVRVSFPRHQFFLLIIIVLLLLSSIAFSVAIIADIESIQELLNKILLANITLGLFLVSIILSFLITVIDNSRLGRADYFNMKQETFDNLMRSFDRTSTENFNVSGLRPDWTERVRK